MPDGDWADTGGSENILLWKGFPTGLADDHVLGATDVAGPQTAEAGGVVEATKDEGVVEATKDGGRFQLGTAGLAKIMA